MILLIDYSFCIGVSHIIFYFHYRISSTFVNWRSSSPPTQCMAVSDFPTRDSMPSLLPLSLPPWAVRLSSAP